VVVELVWVVGWLYDECVVYVYLYLFVDVCVVFV